MKFQWFRYNQCSETCVQLDGIEQCMKYFFKKVKFLSIVGGTFLMLATGCKLDNDSEPLPPAAYVSVYNASPNSPGLNIILDSKVVNNTSFDYSDHTGYLRFFAGNRKLAFGPFQASNVVADTTMKFEDSKAYSVFVVNNFQDVDLLVLSDNTDEPGAGKAKLRFLNLSPDAPEVNLAEGDNANPLFTGLAFKEPSEFIEVDAKKYDFKVKSLSGDVLLNMPDAVLLDGWSYTVLVRGYKTVPSGSQSVLSSELIVD
jgi:hypothetical protein